MTELREQIPEHMRMDSFQMRMVIGIQTPAQFVSFVTLIQMHHPQEHREEDSAAIVTEEETNIMLKSKMRVTIFGVLVIAMSFIAATFISGCGELDTNLSNVPDIPGPHPIGWAELNSADFHGKYILSNNEWNLKLCTGCHGEDYKGGGTGLSCYKCHSSPQGPEECSLCHGSNGKPNPPRSLNGQSSTAYIGVGAHSAHLDSNRWSAKLQCNDCHLPVNSFDDTNHIGATPNGIADITFGALSRTSLGGNITPDPNWNRSETKCSNTYCHGTFKNGNVNSTANWVSSASVYCGTCHGDPQTGNPNPKPNGVYVQPHGSSFTVNQCYLCHSAVINSSGLIVNKDKHVNGVVNFAQ